MSDSDTLYHRLFSDPLMVEGLVCEFAPHEVTTVLNFRGLQRVNPKFHFSRSSARRREADVIWRLRMRGDRGGYLYLLIEFQSKSDQWMAVRTGVYQGLLWQQVIDEQRLQSGARVPPLLLLVLYNGERRWKVASETRDLIALSPDSSLWPWQPRSRYCLLDIGAFPKDELVRRSSLVALLFRLEQHYSPEGLVDTVEDVVRWFSQHEGHERLQALFAELIRETFSRHGLSLPKSVSLLEMKTMLLSQMDTWKEQLVAKAKSEAKAEGKAEGKAEDLIVVLAERFGTVAPPWRKLIQEAELETLDLWFKRAIVAPDLASVFNRPVETR
jgi:predicted transposase YdaD